MSTTVIVAPAVALVAFVAILVAWRARARSRRRLEELVRQLEDRLEPISRSMQEAVERSAEARERAPREPIVDVEAVLERIVAEGATTRVLKELADEMSPRDVPSGIRTEYETELEREIAKARGTGRPLSLVVLDLGSSPEQDRVLEELAALLQRVTRATDTVCRRGESDFGILLPGTTADGAQRFHRRVREQLERTSLTQAGQMTFAAGLVEWRPDETSDSLDARASAAIGTDSVGAYGQRPVR